MRRPRGSGFGMLCRDANEFEGLTPDNANQVGRRIQLAECPFDADFPDGCRADKTEDVGIGDDAVESTRKLVIVGKPPEQDMGVEQQVAH